ncbi:hypothetical protein VTI74DRAFT_1962 [Chaetomium olivicolor]
MKLPIFFSIFLPAWALVSSPDPMLCTSSPPLALEAGVSIVSAAFSGKITGRCTATLTFADTNFLPVTYEFDPPTSCQGPLLASFIVPAAAPNGNAWVKWQCAGFSASCSHGVITGGKGDPSTPVLNKGTLDCVSDFAQVATTLVTLTSTTRAVTGMVSTASSMPTATLLPTSASGSLRVGASSSMLSSATSVSTTDVATGWHTASADPQTSTTAPPLGS